MNAQAALNSFWNGFGWNAFEENTVPENAFAQHDLQLRKCYTPSYR